MKIYLKLDGDIVRDVIAYPYSGYVPGETESFPDGFLGGWYRWQNGFVFDQTLYDAVNAPQPEEPDPDAPEQPAEDTDYKAYYEAVSAALEGVEE